MPADMFTTTYSAYKKGTTKLTTWLVESARRCGIQADTRPQAVDNVPATAKQGQKKPQKYPIPVKEFTNLAKAIAASAEPRISIPKTLASVVRNVISLRKQFTKFYAKAASSGHDNGIKASNARHRHFTSVLEEVLAIFEPSDVEFQDEATGTSTFNSKDLIAALADDEVASQTSQKTDSASTIEYEPDTADIDRAFAVFSFFEETNEIRNFCITVWQDYRIGRLDLMSASVTTDTAFNVLKRSSQEILDLIPGATNWSALISILMPAVEADPATFLDRCCVQTARILDGFADVLHPRQIPDLKPDHFGTLDPKQDRSKLSKAEQEREDLIILMELLPEFTKLSRFRIEVPAQDELTSGLRKMMDGSSINAMPMYVIFASQVLLDIHHVLREDVTRPFDQLQETGTRVKATLDDYFKYSRNKRIANWPPQNDEVLRRILSLASDWTLSDMVKAAGSSHPRATHPGAKPRPFHLLKNHPVLCGLLTFRLNMLLQDAGIHVCNAWGSALYPAHLYNAARRSADLEVEWKDMDYIISVHSASRLFVGAPPSDAAEYHKRFLLALGGSAVNFARNRRPGGSAPIVPSKKGPRGLKITSPVKDVFRPRYVEDGAAAFTTPNMVAMLAVASKAERTSRPSVDLEAFAREMVTRRQYTTLQLLQIVREGVAAEELHLLYNYLGLHQRGCDFLRALRTALDTDLVDYFGPTYIDDESQLPYVVGYVFEVVRGSDRIAEETRIKRHGSKMLHNAADVLRDFLGDNVSGVGAKSLITAKALSNSIVNAYSAGAFDYLLQSR